MGRFKWIALALLVLVGGCATAAQRAAQQMNGAAKLAMTEFAACDAAVRARPEFAAVLARVPLSEQASIAQLTDNTVPTENEARLVAAIHDENLKCRQRLLEQARAIEPRVAGALLAGWQEGDENTVLLVQRKITWAEATKRRQQIMARTRANMDAAHQQDMGQLEAAHEAELARRQQALDRLYQWSVQQQMLNSLNRPAAPIFTTCNQMGSFVNCTTH